MRMTIERSRAGSSGTQNGAVVIARSACTTIDDRSRVLCSFFHPPTCRAARVWGPMLRLTISTKPFSIVFAARIHTR
jgi:hypothetical protein